MIGKVLDESLRADEFLEIESNTAENASFPDAAVRISTKRSTVVKAR